MRSNYKKLGLYIRETVEKNADLSVGKLLGVSITKRFIPSIANIVGTDMSTYKIVRTNQFAYGPVTSRNGDKISVALLQESDCIVSTSYTTFELIDTEELDPEYLMMWFRRPEFDRYARFMSHGSVRELFDWEEMCDVELPIPNIDKQREIVHEYNIIVERIKLNEQLNQKLEETAQALYKQWFVDYKYSESKEVILKYSGYDEFGEIPQDWDVVPLSEVTNKIGSGSTPRGGKDSYKASGLSLIRSQNVFDYNFVYENLAFIDGEQAKKLDNVSVESGDVLINITGVSVSRCCLVPDDVLPARVNQHVAIVRCKPNLDLSVYVLLALCSTDYKNRLLGISEGGSTRQALTKTDLEEALLLLPSGAIIEKFNEICRPIMKHKQLLVKEREGLIKIKNLLLERLATFHVLQKVS